MSAEQLTDSCIAAIEEGTYSLIVINYANPDMVGHTGVMDAATEAIATVDRCVGRLLDSVGRRGGTMLITADHGNAELMQGPDGQPGRPTPPTRFPAFLWRVNSASFLATATPSHCAATADSLISLRPCCRFSTCLNRKQ